MHDPLMHDMELAVDPVKWARRALTFDPDPQQISILTTPSRRILINCCRQWGKSSIVAAKALHTALYCDAAFVIVIGPTLRQTNEMFRKIAIMAANLGYPSPEFPLRSDGHNSLSLLLPNQSRILGLPALDINLRGFSAVDLLIVDEAARIPDSAYTAARPFLARARNGGSIVLLSTPWGQRGFFYHAWMGTAVDGLRRTVMEWMRVRVPASECLRLSPEFLEEERRSLPDFFFRQEYGCEFQPCEGQIFTEEMLQRACDDSFQALFGNDFVNPEPRITNGWLWNSLLETNHSATGQTWNERVDLKGVHR